MKTKTKFASHSLANQNLIIIDKDSTQSWKDLFTNPDVKNTNIICNFKAVNANNTKIKDNKLQYIVSAYFFNRNLILGEKQCLILSYLIRLFDLQHDINLLIVRKDIGESKLNFNSYFMETIME